MKIKALVFDIGDVVLSEHADKSRKKLVKKFGFDSATFRDFAKKRLKQSYVGKLSAEDFFGGLAKRHGVDVDVDEMISFWIKRRRKETRFNKKVFRLIKKLKKNYFLASLTDTTALNDIVREEVGVYDVFDLNVVSSKEGFRKPDKKLYEILLKKLKKKNILPEEMVFIDDEVRNLVPAKRLGMNVIRFEGFGKMKNELKRLGVRV